MGDFNYSSVSSMSSITADSYVLNTSSSSGVFYSSAPEGGKSTITMQDDRLLEQSGGVKGPPVPNSSMDPTPDDHQPQTISTSQEEENKSGINGKNIMGGSVNVGPMRSITTVGPQGTITSLGSSVLGHQSGAIPTAAIVAASCPPMSSGMVPGNTGAHPGGATIIDAGTASIPSSLSPTVASLWSHMDDSGMSINGSLPFSNMGPGATGNHGGPSPLFSSLGNQMGMGTTGIPQNMQQRRNMQPGGPNFPVQTRPQNLGHATPQGPFLTNKYSGSWSTGTGIVSQGNTWSASCPSPQGTASVGGGVVSPVNSIGGAGSWSRGGRGGGVGSASPMGIGAVPSVRSSAAKLPNNSILMNKYRKHTGYAPKGPFPHQQPTFEITGVEDGAAFPRELLQYNQDCRTNGVGNGTSALENMRAMDNSLNDIMRSDHHDNMKGKSQAAMFGMDDGGLLLDETHLDAMGAPLPLPSPSRSSPRSQGSENGERFSRKVFVGGLPPDIDEEEITASFNRFGPLVVDWPHKAESKSYFPPKGYAFLLFQDESSVQQLIDACIQDEDKLYLCVSSPTIKDKPVQIRPWKLSDADYVLNATLPLDPRKTVFVGGVPRPLKAFELAMIMERLYGGVCYAGIDTDPELKYPKGAGRVAFSNQQSYIAAISARFVQLQHGDIDKRVEVKPYVLDDQMCDECQGSRCGGKFAPFFCANVTCLQYYCEHCWQTIHTRPGREYHKPLVKEGADRPRTVPFRWC